jgi:hypothetical protein
MEKDFRYFIVDDLGRSYWVDGSGTVQVSSLPKELNYTPDGWQDKTISFGRNSQYHGLVRTFSLPMRFAKDGGRILRYIYYQYGIQGVANLVILKRDIISHTDVYQEYYTGSIDLSQIDDQQDNDTVECNVMEGGLSMLINANENTKYEIPLDDDALVLLNDGIFIKGSASYGIQQGEAGTESQTLLGCLFVDQEGTFKDIIFNTVFSFIAGETIPPVPPNTVDYLIRNDGADQVFTLAFKFRVTCALNTAYILRLNISDGNSYLSTTIPFSGTIIDDAILEVDVTTDVTLLTGQRLIVSVTGGFGSDPLNYMPDGTLKITFNARYKSTTTKCYRAIDVFKQLISKITDGKYTADSALLNGAARDYVITCGDAIRGLSGAKLKTSLSDFFRSINARFNIGLGIKNGQAIIEEKKYFYNDNTIVDLGEVARLSVSPAADYLFNTLKVGWPSQSYDDVNGRDEFNNTFQYTTPITRIAKELDLSSAYRADCYGIEFTRINLENKTTTDNDSDNDIFFINVKDDGVGGLLLNRPDFDSLSGVIAGSSVYNVLLSPKRCLLEAGNYLRAGLDKQETNYLKFQTTEKNAELVTTLDGVTITEKSDVPISSLNTQLFLPILFELDAEVPTNIVNLIDSDPYGLVKFTWQGNQYVGYIIECSQQPTMNPKQTFKLLAGKDNNMLNLI